MRASMMLLLFLGLVASADDKAKKKPTEARASVLVELFTSQG